MNALLIKYDRCLWFVILPYFPMQNVYLPTQTIFVLRKSLYINGELFE